MVPPSLIEGRKLRGKTPPGGAGSFQGALLDPQRSCSKRRLWRLFPLHLSGFPTALLVGPLPSGPTTHLSPSPGVHASSPEAPQTPNPKSCPKCCWGPSRDQVCQQGFYPNFIFFYSGSKKSAFPSSMRNPILSASPGLLRGPRPCCPRAEPHCNPQQPAIPQFAFQWSPPSPRSLTMNCMFMSPQMLMVKP